MDLLETILRSGGAAKHLETFRQQHVDVNVLPLLSDRDLQVLGITNANLRAELLKRFSSLLIPAEKPSDTTVTIRYAEEVLLQMTHQLNFHHANLTAALGEHIDVCDFKFEKSILSLKSCIQSLDEQLDKFHNKMEARKYRKRRAIMGFLFVGGVSLIALLLVKHYKGDLSDLSPRDINFYVHS